MRKVIFKHVLDGIMVERVIRDEEFSMPSSHIHPEFEIYYLISGTRHYFIEDNFYHIGKSSLVLIDTMQIHKTSAYGKEPHERFLVELTAEPFAGFFFRLTGESFQYAFKELAGVWELDEDERCFVDDIFATITSELNEQKLYYQTLVMMKLAELLFYVARLKAERRVKTSSGKSSKHIQINGVTDYISTNYDKPISLDMICKRFYINKSYLCRAFKDVTGSTVQEYIHMCRIKKAQELLKGSNMSISEVSDAIGFGTLTHFERVFRKYMETTPFKYRKKMLLIEQKVRERKSEDAV